MLCEEIDASTPTGAEVAAYVDRLSNWGRWGEDDQLGTLNLIKPEHRVAAAKLVSEGRTVSCARDLITAFGDPSNTAQMFYVVSGQGLHDGCCPPSRFGAGNVASAFEYVGFVYHGPNVTHLDMPSHLFWKGKLYNNRPAGMTTSENGALWCPVTQLRNGVTGRGVLLDVPRFRGLDALPAGTAVGPQELDAVAKAQGVTVGEGDIVLLRTGRWHPNANEGAATRESDDPAHWAARSGWAPACLPWMHERGVSVIGCDYAQDASTGQYAELPAPIHVVGLVSMGLPLIDNCDLEELAATCAELNRWEFQFVISPLRLRGGSGSPLNPIAVF
jgi:kynurenine formamidase